MYTRRVLFRILTQALGGASLAILGSIRLFCRFFQVCWIFAASCGTGDCLFPISIFYFFPLFQPRNPANLDHRGFFCIFFGLLCQNPEVQGSKIAGAEVFIVVYQEKGGETPGKISGSLAGYGTQDPAKVDLFMNKKSSLMKGQAV